MRKLDLKPSTGIPALDRVLRGVLPGDNLVWQVESVRDYLPFVKPFAAFARENGRTLTYFRFADHEPLLGESDGVTVYPLHPEKGFEPFLQEIHRTVDAAGRGALFVFDIISALAPDWCSDRMLGNFFLLTCPYLYDASAVAYFGVLRNRHSFHAIRPIRNTTQVLIDVYRRGEQIYIHPLKVERRHSPTLYMIHAWKGEAITPVSQTCVISEILKGVPWSRLDSSSYRLGPWSQTFAEAETVQEEADRVGSSAREPECFSRILRMMISHDERILRLAERYLTLRDLLDIRRRMIGTGLIGGKSVGMILARAVLRKTAARWSAVLEEHDSFFIGADVFYTFLVENGCWWTAQKLKGSFGRDSDTITLRRRMLAGEFPEYIVTQFSDMLDYFGQSPIIVRSSSLLEDNYGNAFAGKYESVFCANQGGPHQRLEEFLAAVRSVYASTMSEEALHYRAQRGLLGSDEQMGLLVQRVSGARYGTLFYPQAAGVAFSFNPYVWHESIDPRAGMVRLVFGLGTRAVDRSDDDYTRIVALNAPERRPEANLDEVSEYSQHRVDVLDLEANALVAASFDEVVARSPELPMDLFVSRRQGAAADEYGRPIPGGSAGVLTFDGLLKRTSFVKDLREMLGILQAAYGSPVDVEFTLNVPDPATNECKINVLQCRPFSANAMGGISDPPENLPPGDVVLECRGSVIGKSVETVLDWILYVIPAVYGELPVGDRYGVARLIGDLTHHPQIRSGTILLAGPGRWGTATPELGVPSAFAEIEPASVLCEIVAMREDLVPDVSLGTHFFSDLVENDMLYMAIFPNREQHGVNRTLLEEVAPNRLNEYLPAAGGGGREAVRLIRCADVAPPGGSVRLHAHTLKQRAVVYIRRSD